MPLYVRSTRPPMTAMGTRWSMGCPWRPTDLSGCAKKGLGFDQFPAAGSGGLYAYIHRKSGYFNEKYKAGMQFFLKQLRHSCELRTLAWMFAFI